jgi:hypothetical protein
MATVELAKYKLLPGADPKMLAEVEQQIQTEIGPKHPGYLGRELLCAADGSYILIMRWENQESASTWNNTLFSSEAGRKLGSLVDPKSMSKEILTTL